MNDACTPRRCRHQHFKPLGATARILGGDFIAARRAIALFACLSLSISVATAQTAGLVAAYSFDEGAGTTIAVDLSGNGNDGVLVNGTSWSSTATFGTAANFDGTNDRIDVPDSNSLDLTSGMTLEAWVRPTANSSYRTVVLKEVPGELSYALYSADSDHGTRPSGWVRLNNSSRFADGTASIPLNVYTHIAVTFNGTTLAMYVNGILATTTNVAGTIQTSAFPLRIGGNTVWGEYFRGQIDEVRIYSRALSQAEIQTDMATPIGSGGGGGGGGGSDTTPPTVSLTAPSNGATVAGTVSISANASDNIGIVGVQFMVDGAILAAEDTAPPYSVVWNTSTTSAGSHTLTAVARDAAGNSTAAASVAVVVDNADTQAPSVSLTAPANGTTAVGSVAVTANASDNVGVVGVQFKLDGGNLGTEVTTSPYGRTWDSRTASNGTHSLTAVARDAAGNTTTSAARTVTVSNGDTVAPTVAVTSPVSGATVSNSISVIASASDNVGVVGVQFKLDGGNLGTEDTTSPYGRTWDSRTASNGTHSLTAVARDAAGNTTTSAARTVTVSNGDTVAPTVAVTSPVSGATVSNSISVIASASDNVGVVGVQFKLDGGNLGTEDTTSPYRRTWDSRTASNGTHSLTAVARDAAGNTMTSAARTVTVSNGDTVAPTVAVTSPVNGATVSGSTTVTASASDNVGIAGVQFRIDGTSLGAEDTAAPYTVSWNTATATNGTHLLTAVARDQAGNSTTSAAASVTVSNTGGTALTIDGSQRFQTIDGFGISANAASWDNGELRPAIDMLMDQGGSTIWRVVMEMADWEASNDDSNSNNFNWTYYNTVYSSPRFEELWSTLSYLNQKGITSTLMLNFMGRGPVWMGGPDLPTAMEDEWVETVASVAYYARNVRNIQFGLFAPNNESDWDGIEGIRMDQSQYTRVMRNLSQKLDAIGLGDLRLIGPDTASISAGVSSYMPAMMSDPILMAKLDHFAFHSYSGDSGGANAAIQNSAYPSTNFWMTELSNIWDAMANVGQGAAAILVWDGYDSVYNHAILAGRGTSPPNDAGNGPALLAYNTSTHVYTPRKPFYEFAQLFKFISAGSARVAATESNSSVTIFAFHHAVTGRVTLVGRNAASGNVTFSGTLRNLPAVPSFEFYRTDASVNLQRGSDVPVANGSFSFIAPGNSMFTLTYAGPADTVPPVVSVTSPSDGATVSGTVTVSSNTAADNFGVTGVQFRLDGALLGVEDTVAPFSLLWTTTTTVNGSHILTAVARDAAGNVTTSSPRTVIVSNTVSP